MPTDSGSGGLVGAVQGIIAGLGNLFRGKVDGATKFSLLALRVAIAGLAEQLTNYATETTGKQSSGAGILIRLWDAVLLPFFQKADRRILKIYNWLKDTFGPVISALLWIRKHIIKFYDHWFKPIFDTIDAVRGILRIMGLLHIDVARKLDEKLARLEARILAPLRIALQTINQLIDWTQRIIDGDGFFQRYTLVRSLLKHERDMWQVWWTSIHRSETENAKAPPAAVGVKAAEDVAGEAITALNGGDTPGSALASEVARTALASLGGHQLLA